MDKPDYLQRYLERGFGTMTKNDFEVFIFSELLKAKFQGKSNYAISCELKIPESKVKRLRYEANLKYEGSIAEKSKDAFLESIKKVKIRKDGNDKQKIVFSIEDVAIHKYIESLLKDKGSFADYSFNSELLVVNIDDFVMLIDECFGEEKKTEIKKRINKDSKETFVTQLKPVIKTMVGNRIGEVVSFALDEILNGVKVYLSLDNE